MAAIDKLYVKNFWDLDDLRNWALVYYPKLFLYFYSDIFTMTERDFTSQQQEAAESRYKNAHKVWKEISSDGTLNSAIAYYINTGMTEEEAEELARDAYLDAHKSINQLRVEVAIPIMNTPFKVDKKLKWICPLSCIREYLQNQCGVKEHWYYKIFWRGKKHFML